MLIGYCCINTILKAQKEPIYTNRTATRKTFSKEKASELALKNVKDLEKILHWNESKGIKVFRISSSLFTHATDGHLSYLPEDLKDGQEIHHTLKRIGKYAYDNGHILGFHPDHFTVISSEREDVVDKGLLDLEFHNHIIELLSMDAPNLVCNINWHVGGRFSKEAADRFVKAWKRLSRSTQLRSCIENDDKGAGWSVKKLYQYIYSETGIPITHDLHHSLFTREPELSLQQEFELAKETWKGRWQEVHYSESSDMTKIVPGHSDFYQNKLPDFLNNEKIYVHLECKAKEAALLDYERKFGKVTHKHAAYS